MREIRLSGSEGGETGIQPVFPTPINLATISPRSRHGLATVSLRSRRGLAFVWHYRASWELSSRRRITALAPDFTLLDEWLLNSRSCGSKGRA
jgi:hypothetical protein